MALCGRVHHRIGFMLGKYRIQRRAVADVGLLEGICGAFGHRGHIVEAGGIGQRIDG